MSERATTPRAAWFAPLGRQLPLLISALLATVVVAYTWFAHDRLHGALEDAARERLVASADRFSGIVGESTTRFTRELRAIAADPAVVQLVETGGAASPESAAAALRGGVPSARMVSRALWSAECRLIASAGRAPIAPCPVPRRVATTPGSQAVGPLAMDGDSIQYAITVPVTGRMLETMGFLVETRTIGGGNSAMIQGLIGENVQVYLGNGDGGFWTDLMRPVNAPPLPPEERVATFAERDGTPVLGVLATVPGAPWRVVLVMPRHVIAAPARALLWSMLLAAALCLAAGALGASMIGRRVTGRIGALASAAAGIAGGDYSRRVPVAGRDEMAHFAGAFNDMAARVESATDALQAHATALEEQVQVARAARRDTALVRSLLEDVLASAPVGVALFDMQLRYVRANAAMARLNALPADDHIGNTPAQVDPSMGELMEPLLVQVRASGETVANRRITARGDGRSRRHWLVTSFPVHDHEGALTGVGIIVADTTAHMELETQFLHVQKMEAVGRLAGGVAHDFNNLLTVILSYSSMAVESLPGDDPLRGDLVEIRDAALRAAALTRQLLAFSRNQVLEPQQLNLNDTVRGMQRLLERLLGSDVTLDLTLADDLGDVRADPGQMEQVIMNLVVNARDAMPEGGRIRVATSNAWLTAEHPIESAGRAPDPAACVVLSVADTGTGIADEVRAQIFEPFFTTKPAGKGTGLGLSTVYGIVTQSGGSVRAEDHEGPGTTFVVRLPRAG